MKNKAVTKYVFIGIFASLIALSLLLVKPFLTAILGGIVFALIFYPVHKWLKHKLKRRALSAFIVTLVAILIVIIPVLLVFQQVTYQSKVTYILVKQKLVGGELVPETVCLGEDSLMCNLNAQFKETMSQPNVVYYRDRALEYIEEKIWEITPNIIMAIPRTILNIFIMIFVMFYALKDGAGLFNRFSRMLPLKHSHKKQIVQKVKDVSQAIVYGHVITGLVQGVIGTLGFYAFGVTSPLVLGIIMTLAALIPLVGATFVWAPIALLKMLDGLASVDHVIFWRGLGLFLYGVFIISTIDNIIKPKITGDKAKVSPVIILLGLLGGLTLFGLVGIIVGPLILALTKTFIEIYEKEKDEITG